MFAYKRLTLALALAAATAVTGACARRPNATPGPNAAGPITGANIADLNMDASGLASAIPGVGRVDALVVGNLALVALHNQIDQYAGTPGMPGTPGITGSPGNVGAPGATGQPVPGQAGPGATGTLPGGLTSAPSPGASAAPGGTTGNVVARPGGGAAPGPVMPGGSPTSVTGTPGTATSPAAWGGPTTPMNAETTDLHTRVAVALAGRYPWLAEVRYAVTPEQATRLGQITAQVHNGVPISYFLGDLAAMVPNMQPTANMIRPMPDGLPGVGTAPNRSVPGPAAPSSPVGP